MAILIDTNIAIYLRDRQRYVIARIAERQARPAFSLVTLIELEGGLRTDADLRQSRQAGLEALLTEARVLDLDEHVVTAYGTILDATGFSRTRVLDRLIAATALVHGLTLVTMNGDDFRDIPGLNLEVWPAPQ